MADFNQEDQQSIVLNLVNDAVTTNANSPEVKLFDELFCACGPRLIGQRIDRSFNSPSFETREIVVGFEGRRAEVNQVKQTVLFLHAFLDLGPRNATFFFQRLASVFDIDKILHAFEQLEVLDGDDRCHRLTSTMNNSALAPIFGAAYNIGELCSSCAGGMFRHLVQIVQ